MAPSAGDLMEESPLPATLEDAHQEIGRLRAQLYLANSRRAELFLKLEQQRRSFRAALKQAKEDR